MGLAGDVPPLAGTAGTVGHPLRGVSRPVPSAPATEYRVMTGQPGHVPPCPAVPMARVPSRHVASTSMASHLAKLPKLSRATKPLNPCHNHPTNKGLPEPKQTR